MRRHSSRRCLQSRARRSAQQRHHLFQHSHPKNNSSNRLGYLERGVHKQPHPRNVPCSSAHIRAVPNKYVHRRTLLPPRFPLSSRHQQAKPPLAPVPQHSMLSKKGVSTPPTLFFILLQSIQFIHRIHHDSVNILISEVDRFRIRRLIPHLLPSLHLLLC